MKKQKTTLLESLVDLDRVKAQVGGVSKQHTSPVEEDFARLRENLLLMGGCIESMLKDLKNLLSRRSPDEARRLAARDEQVDQMEKSVDEIALQILALRQPAARDLRYVRASLKITTDLERMGDEVKNVCERIEELEKLPQTSLDEEIMPLVDMIIDLVSKSLDIFVSQSSQEAGQLLNLDDQVDDMHRNLYHRFVSLMKAEPDKIESVMKYLYMAKYLERIGDHATNLAEQVIFAVEGYDIRHTRDLGPTPYSS